MRKALQVLVLLVPWPLWAQSAPTVDELVKEALKVNPSVEELRLRLAEARVNEVPAGTLPDPMVDFMLTDARFPRFTVGKEEMSMLGVTVRQDLRYPGKLSSREKQAQAETGVRELELARLKAEVVAAIRETYAELYALDVELEKVEEALDLLQVLQETAQARYAAGFTSQEAAVKAVLIKTRLQERKADLARQRAELVAMLNRLCNRPLNSPLGPVRGLPPYPPLPQNWQDLALEQAPEVKVMQAEVAAAAREVEVAKAELKPNLFATAGLGTRGSFGAVATLGFGLEWPFWRERKQKPELEAAQLRLKAAQARLEAVRAAVREEIEKTQAAWRNAHDQQTRYQQEILPLAMAALEAARATFLTGQVDFSTVIEDFNLWLEAEVGFAQRQAQAFAAWARISLLLGESGGES